MADSRQSAESKTLQVWSLDGGEIICFFVIAFILRVIVLLLPRSQYVPHLEPHAPLLASWWSLICYSMNGDALLEITHITLLTLIATL